MRLPLRTQTPVLAAGVVVAAFLSSAALLSAHDFWLVPNAFDVTPGGVLEVRGQTSSSFPTSESAVALDRIADARALSSSGSELLRDLTLSGTSLLIRHRPATAGQRVVAVALKPRSTRESAEGFRRYMVLEGAPELAARYEREGLLPMKDSITRRYAKYAKTLVEVGSGGPRAFSRSAGHPAEFVPLSDPATLRAGDTLGVRLLYRGKPLAAAHIHAGTAAINGRSDSATKDLSITTDAQGVARVPVSKPGLWNVRTIHIVPAERGSGADWDVHWSTLVFAVKGDGAGTSRPIVPTQGSDSAAVVAVIDSYHRALATGDSVAALALLAADAVILESGGVETREEYRGHHLPGDIGFARAVPSKRGAVLVVVRGDAAWASSTSMTQGEYRGRQINSSGAELVVLSRETDGWKIRAIHWSSRTRK